MTGDFEGLWLGLSDAVINVSHEFRLAVATRSSQLEEKGEEEVEENPLVIDDGLDGQPCPKRVLSAK